jgi:hypothetical protein
LVAPFRPDFDEVIRFHEEVGIVLNNNDGVALVDESVEEADEAFAIVHMEPDGRFLEDV